MHTMTKEESSILSGVSSSSECSIELSSLVIVCICMQIFTTCYLHIVCIPAQNALLFSHCMHMYADLYYGYSILSVVSSCSKCAQWCCETLLAARPCRECAQWCCETLSHCRGSFYIELTCAYKSFYTMTRSESLHLCVKESFYHCIHWLQDGCPLVETYILVDLVDTRSRSIIVYTDYRSRAACKSVSYTSRDISPILQTYVL